MVRIGLAAITLFFAASVPASAASNPASHEGHYVQETSAISALLTPLERRSIRRERSRVQALENRARADGVVTRAERRQINRAHRQLDAYIRAARAS